MSEVSQGEQWNYSNWEWAPGYVQCSILNIADHLIPQNWGSTALLPDLQRGSGPGSIRKGSLKLAVLESCWKPSDVCLPAGRQSVVTSQFLGKPLPGKLNLELLQA